jgi:hypothetical protein
MYLTVLVLMVVVALVGLFLRTRAYKVSAFAIVALLVVAAPLIGLNVRGLLEEDRYSEVVVDLTKTMTGQTQYANSAATVDCQSPVEGLLVPSSEAGFVEYPAVGKPRVATLQTYVCNDLRHYVNGGHEDPTFNQVTAVHVLTHEAMHLGGETSEKFAECMAVQRDYLTAKALGASDEDAADLAKTYYAKHYPKTNDSYQDPECKPKGDLDERLPHASWVEKKP